MYSSDVNSTNLDSFQASSRLFNLNDTQNIWSNGEKPVFSNDLFFNNIRSRSLFNGSGMLTPQILTDRQAKPRKAATGERRDTNLIVNYLPDGFFEKDLYDLFSKAGPIAHYHVVRNKENRSECYGFVDFEKAADAEKAIDMFHQYPIQNKKLKVQNAYEGLLIKQEEKERTEKGLLNMGYNVEVKNAPNRWTVNDVKNIFGKYGEMMRVYENMTDELTTIENGGEIKTKTFNIIYRYQTIASKVVKRKSKVSPEPFWPLGLELTIVGQEFVDTSNEPARCRSRNTANKPKFDQISTASWEGKFGLTDAKNGNLIWDESKIDLQSGKQGLHTPAYDVNYWTDCGSGFSTSMTPLSASGRPILKHKDNLMHLAMENEDMNPEHFLFRGGALNDATGRMMNNVLDDCASNSGSSIVMGGARKLMSDSALKSIWDYKNKRNMAPSDLYSRTQLLPSRFDLNKKPGGKYRANVWLKMEYQQPTGSFKLRGMAYACFKAKWDGVGLVVSSSGGNAGLAVAYACRMLKMRCTVVVPSTSHPRILEQLAKEGADVIQEGSCWREAHARAELVRDAFPGLSRLIHPFDDPALWTGYETIVDEIMEEMKDEKVDMIVAAVGGGGLLNGLAQGITKHNLNKTTALLAMETEGTACLNKATVAKQLITIAPEGVASSLGASRASQRSLDIFLNQEHHVFSMTCSDAEAVDSCFQFLYEQSVLVEPACGAALSALYSGSLDHMAECRACDLNVVVVVCGGRAVEIDDLFQMRLVLSQQQMRHWQQQPHLDLLPQQDPDDGGLDSFSFGHRFSTLDIAASKTEDIFQTQQPPAPLFHKQQLPPPPFSYSSVASKNLAVGSKDQQQERSAAKIAAQTTANILQAAQSDNSSSGANSKFGFGPDPLIFYPPTVAASNNDMAASPLGSQHSDKENRCLAMPSSSDHN